MSLLKVGDVKKVRCGKTAKIISIDACIGGGDFNIVALIDVTGTDGTDKKINWIEWYKEVNVFDGHLLANAGREDGHDIVL